MKDKKGVIIMKKKIYYFVTMTTTLVGTFFSKTASTIYMTYIHANRNVTLAQSKNYKFSSTGLGKVLNFTSDTIKSYYQTPAPMTFSLTPQYIK